MTGTKPRSPGLRRIATVLLLVATVAVAGCGSSTKIVSSTGSNGQATTQTVPNVHFAKTRLLLHTGLAFGAIHRYIYKPLRAGALRSGAPGRIKVLLKGAAAHLGAGAHYSTLRPGIAPLLCHTEYGLRIREVPPRYIAAGVWERTVRVSRI
jgi:hypothetical protein